MFDLNTRQFAFSTAMVCLWIGLGVFVFHPAVVKAGERPEPGPHASIAWEPSPAPVAAGNSGRLKIRASEAIYLLYAGNGPDGKTRIDFAHSHNIGDSFSPPHRVNGEGERVSSHGENGPQLETGRGIEIYTAWQGDDDIKFARSMDFGRSFSSPLRINDDDGDHSQSFFTMKTGPDGAVYIAWLDGRDKPSNRPGTSSLYLAASRDGGKTFSKNIKIAGDICPCCRPSIAFGPSGKMFVAWRHVYDGHERVIVVASSEDGGKTWSDPVRVTGKGWVIDGCAHAGPSARFINGKLYVTWYTGDGDRAAVKLAVSNDSGKSFTGVREIQGPVLDANHPYIAESQDSVHVIFQGRDPETEGGWGPSQAWVVQVMDDGGVTAPQALPSNGKSIAYPYLFSGTGGRVYATWTEFGKEGPKVVLCRGRIQSQS